MFKIVNKSIILKVFLRVYVSLYKSKYLQFLSFENVQVEVVTGNADGEETL